MNIAILCIVLLAVLAIAMGMAVTVARGKFNVLTGNSDNPEDTLNKLVRAHGNTSEYAAILAIMFYVLSHNPQPSWVLWCIGLCTFCRYLLVAGFVIPRTMAKPNPMRFLGAIGTYLFGLGVCYAVFLEATSF